MVSTTIAASSQAAQIQRFHFTFPSPVPLLLHCSHADLRIGSTLQIDVYTLEKWSCVVACSCCSAGAGQAQSGLWPSLTPAQESEGDIRQSPPKFKFPARRLRDPDSRSCQLLGIGDNGNKPQICSPERTAVCQRTSADRVVCIRLSWPQISAQSIECP
jgi:hypothetical protein